MSTESKQSGKHESSTSEPGNPSSGDTEEVIDLMSKRGKEEFRAIETAGESDPVEIEDNPDYDPFSSDGGVRLSEGTMAKMNAVLPDLSDMNESIEESPENENEDYYDSDDVGYAKKDPGVDPLWIRKEILERIIGSDALIRAISGKTSLSNLPTRILSVTQNLVDYVLTGDVD